MIRAGSLLYAVYVCLLISVMCGALVFIFSYNLELSTKRSIKSDLIDLCDSCINLYVSDSNNFNNLDSETLEVFGNDYQCQFRKSKWGTFTNLTVKAYSKRDTVEKSVFVGNKYSMDQMALYVSDWDETIKFSGATSIKGSLQLPGGRYETINILGNSQLEKPSIQGSVTSSAQNLPKILIEKPIVTDQNLSKTALSKVKFNNLIFNSFKHNPLVLSIVESERLDNLFLKGNVIVNSIDTLYINNSTKLEDVIILAPKVVIQKGFEGSVQIFAEKEIIIEENVVLNYPSSVAILSQRSEYQNKIIISEASEVHGAVIIDGTTFDLKETNEVQIGKSALIIGNLYCNGILQLEGKVLGTVHAYKLKLQSKSGNYQNILLNASIDATIQINGFMKLPLFQQEKSKIYGVIKTL